MPVKTFDIHKKSSRELAKSIEKESKTQYNNISVPTAKKTGFSVPLNNPHQILRTSDVKSELKEQSLYKGASKPEQQQVADDDDDYDDFKPTQTSSFYLPPKIVKAHGEKQNEELKMFPKRKVNPFASKNQAAEDIKIPAKKKRIRQDEQEINRLIKSLDKAKADDERERKENKIRCPYCDEVLFPITEPIRKALIVQEKENQAFAKSQKENSDAVDESNSFSRPAGFVLLRPVSYQEKEEFCKLHRLELVIKPEGIKKDYPREIDFSQIETRVKKLDGELKDVICKRIKSDYRDLAEDAYKEQGQVKARSVTSVLHRFTVTLPGYYGPKGAAEILKALSKMYVDTGYLANHLVSSQLPLEYLQQVLVPETGYRLIRGDLAAKGTYTNINDKAKQIMAESSAYGNAMFPAKDEDEDEVGNQEEQANGDEQYSDGDYGDDKVVAQEVFTVDSEYEDEQDNSDDFNDNDDEVTIKEVYTIDSD